MLKCLNVPSLGVVGRQSEIIELALTYGFEALDLDLGDLLKRADSPGLEHARRFLSSAKLRVGGFDLPIRWQAESDLYQQDLQKLADIGEIAASLKAECAYVTVNAASDLLPYHENFDQSRERLSEIAEGLNNHGVKLAIGFQAAAAHRDAGQFQFLYETGPFLTLIKSLTSKNAGLLLDTWNWVLGGGTIEQLSELDPHQLVAVRLADMPADVQQGDLTDEDRYLPGVGTIDVAAYVAALGAFRFQGPIAICPHGNRFDSLKRDVVVQQVRDTFNRLWVDAGLTPGSGPVAETATGDTAKESEPADGDEVASGETAVAKS